VRVFIFKDKTDSKTASHLQQRRACWTSEGWKLQLFLGKSEPAPDLSLCGRASAEGRGELWKHWNRQRIASALARRKHKQTDETRAAR